MSEKNHISQVVSNQLNEERELTQQEAISTSFLKRQIDGLREVAKRMKADEPTIHPTFLQDKLNQLSQAE